MYSASVLHCSSLLEGPTTASVTVFSKDAVRPEALDELKRQTATKKTRLTTENSLNPEAVNIYSLALCKSTVDDCIRLLCSLSHCAHSHGSDSIRFIGSNVGTATICCLHQGCIVPQ